MKYLSLFIRPLVFLTLLSGLAFTAQAEDAALKASLDAEQKAVAEAQAAKDVAQKKRDELVALQAKSPSADTERKIKDADYEVMMADRKLSSATKSLERLQKKLDENKPATKTATAVPAAVTEGPPAVPSEAEQAKLKAEQEAAKKAAEEKALADKAAAEKAAAEKARKEEEARQAQQKAAAEAAKKAAEADAAAKKQALAAELGIDLNNCTALPTAPVNAASGLSDADKTMQAYAMGDLKRINRLVSEKTIDDVPPVSPFPMLDGSKLKPCDPEQKQALKFGYLGNGQYKLETRVLSGQQDFYVKGVIEPVQRTIPDADNGEIYVFFLDLKYQPRLLAYKKSLFDQAEAQPAQ